MTNLQLVDGLERGFAVGRRFQGRWITHPQSSSESNRYFYFRRVFRLDALPEAVRLHITGETRFVVYINGRHVGRGVPSSQPWFYYYETFEVREYLREGDNALGVLLYFQSGDLAKPALLADLVDGDEQLLLASGERFRTIPAAAWKTKTHDFPTNRHYRFQEHIDLRKLPDGCWQDNGFDDSAWASSSVLLDPLTQRSDAPAVSPWICLHPRDIPVMAESVTRACSVVRTEQCLDVANRYRREDLSIALSQVGTEPVDVTIQNPDALCLEDGDTILADLDPEVKTYGGRFNPCIVLDFGKIIRARVKLTVTAQPGATIRLGYAERLIDGRFNNAIECPFADSITFAGGQQTHEVFTWKAFRFLKLRAADTDGKLIIHDLQAVQSNYPFEFIGLFESGDAELNDIWTISRETVDLCCNESIMDTPWREAAQWLGDVAAVSLGGMYACFGDTALPGKFLRQAAANQYTTGLLANVSNHPDGNNWTHSLTDYSLEWIIGLWNHYLYTGETRWLDELYPTAVRIYQFFEKYVGPDGLLDNVPLCVLIDWADVKKDGCSAPLNALFYRALEILGLMAHYKSDRFLVERCNAIRTAIAESFHRTFFNASTRAFADCNYHSRLDGLSEHASLAAICFGLVDDELAHDIVSRAYVTGELEFPVETQPFFTTFVLQALDRLGRFDLAIQLLHDRWGRHMVQRGATSTYEEWSENGSWRNGEFHGFMRTNSHAWSACPAEFLTRNLIGLKILQPGAAEIQLSPKDIGCNYTVTYPTIHGPVTVTSRNGSFTVDKPEAITIVATTE